MYLSDSKIQKMHFLKKTAIIVASITVLLLLINFGISYWVTQKLPKILQSEKDFPYNINYDDIDVRLISGSFTIYNAYLAPKDSSNTKKNKGTFGKIKQIEVEQFNLWALLWQNHIKVKSITIFPNHGKADNKLKDTNPKKVCIPPYNRIS